MALKSHPKIPVKRKVSRTSLVKKLDTEFSIYVRTRFSIGSKASCFTCDKIDDWKKLQCGHFMSRKHYATRWDEDNCQVQCYACNVMKYGEQYKFGVYLNQIHGEGTAEGLLIKSRTASKIKDFELEEKIEYYKLLNKTFLDNK